MNRFYRTFALLAVMSACTSGPVRRTYTTESGQAPSAQPRTHAPSKEDLIKKAQAQYGNGNYAEASKILESVPEESLRPQQKTEYWNLKGLIELANKTPELAGHSFQTALSSNQNPEFTGYYQYNLASALADQKKNQEALQILNSIDPTHIDPTDQRKIELLKEKITWGGTGSLATNQTQASTPSPSPASTPAKPVYTGAVNSSRIGLLLPMSGKYETFGKKVQQAIELAFQNSPITKKYEIELVPEDSGDSQTTQQDALKKLVEEHQVIAVIGPLLSKGIEGLSELDDFYQTPLISIAQAQGVASPFVYSCSISNEDQAAKVMNYATLVRGFKRFAILAPSNKAGIEMAQAFWDQATAQGGSITAYELYEPGLNDFREPVDKTLGLFYKETRAKESKALADQRKDLNITKKTMKTIQYFELPPIIDFDAVFIADEAKTVGQIIPTFTYRNAKDLSYLGITSWNSPQLVSRAGEQAEGATFPVAFNTLNPPDETKQFYDLYSKTYSAAPGELDAIAYDAASAVLQVLKDRPSTREEFNKKLTAIGNIDGATGVITLKNQHCSRNLTLYTVKKGEFETVKEQKDTTGN